MARPRKRGLDYYPLDVDIFSDERLVCLNMVCGDLGLLTYIRLLNRVYKNGGWCEWGDVSKNSLSHEANRSIEVLQECVEHMLKLGLFSQKIYSDTGCLTSVSIQNRVREATGRRKEFPIPKELLLISIHDGPLLDHVNTRLTKSKVKESKVKVATETLQKPVNVNINPINVDRNPINAAETTQKLPESELKLGMWSNVDISQTELDMLKAQYPPADVDGAIEFLSHWAKGKNKRANAGDIGRFGVRAYRESLENKNGLERRTGAQETKRQKMEREHDLALEELGFTPETEKDFFN